MNGSQTDVPGPPKSMRWVSPGVLMRLAPVVGGLLVAVLSFRAALSEIANQKDAGLVPFFYQRFFEPAVRVACGQPFAVDPAGGLSAAFLGFLNLEDNQLDCLEVAEIPDGNGATPTSQVWFYWLQTVGLIWRVTGPRWDVLDNFAAITYATSAVLLFVLFKFWMRTPVAFALTYIASASALPFLLYQRDLNKAPFILLSLVFSVWVVSRRINLRTLLASSLVMGALLGIGYGFRPDVLIGIPIVAVSLLVFRQAPSWRERILQGTAAILTLGVSFVVVSMPMLKASDDDVGTCQFHFAYLGLSDPSSDVLGLPRENRSFLANYDDLQLARAVNSFGQRTMNVSDFGFCTPTYDAVVQRMFLETVLAFPNDMLDRGAASSRKVLVYGATDDTTLGTIGVAPSDIVANKPLLEWVVLLSWFVLIITALLRSTRIGIYLLFLALFLSFYPTIQFAERHYFHLAFLAYVPLGIGISSLVTLIWNRFLPNQWQVRNKSSELLSSIDKSQVQRSLAALLAVLILTASAAITSDSLQARSLQNLSTQYQSARALTTQYLTLEQNVSTPIHMPQDLFLTERFEGRMLRVSIDPAVCDIGPARLAWTVSGPIPEYSFDGALDLKFVNPSEPVNVYVPVFLESGQLTQLSLKISSINSAESDANPATTCRVVGSWLDAADLPSVWIGLVP